ncbi:neuromedin-U isoform X2 [Callorhinchus milii]|uniref:neuromedin-U isoform X2 n=1 Tax=Callorhinchus milii TaxID=7868 RepID=UPI00045732B5|nr:neuromedin-U isoform X2 [Callorhinchus milii]|eukprot:gi/632950837/ref/XP_007890955.1/ PREDICTED: neuromedin-U isoform X2 [Callorhinchus milii]
MRSSSLCLHREGETSLTATSMKPSPCILTLTLLLLSWGCFSQGVPASSQGLPVDQELRLWNEIDDVCSSFLTANNQAQVSTVFEELCYMATTVLQRIQDSKEKDQTKRFLFHYSKTHDSGNSDFMEELQGPSGIQSRGYFLFRPRNGRSSGFR